MSGPERIEWRRSFPSRPLIALAWYLLCAVTVMVLVLILFGDEPPRLNSGAPNPLAKVPVWTAVGVIVFSVPFVLALARRPRVGATHFALTVRPGWVRTLVLPWSRVAEVVTDEVAGEQYLLVRCRAEGDPMGSSPRWVDRTVLRELARESAKRGRRFDLAVRLRDFTPGLDGHMAALAAFAPDHVSIALHV